MQEAGIHDDSSNPGLEAAFTPKACQATERQEVTRLHGVLCIVGISQNAEGETDARSVVAAKQFGDRVLVSLFTPGNQVGFESLLHDIHIAIHSPNSRGSRVALPGGIEEASARQAIHTTTEFLFHHGYTILFVTVLADPRSW